MAQVSVRKRGKKWEYRFEAAKVGGTRKQISKGGFETKKEAMVAGVKELAKYNEAGLAFQPSTISVADYFDYWLETYCKHNVSDSTYSVYYRITSKHIVPIIGMYALKTVSTSTLQQLINDIYVQYGFKKSYMKNILKVLKGSFKYAYVTAGFIGTNPADNVTLPKMNASSNPEDIIVLNPSQVKEILERFENSPYQYYALLTAYYTGLRVSEVYGLTWDCIDFVNKTITVNKIAKKIEKEGKTSEGKVIRGVRGSATTRWYFGECKTESSYRTIYISDDLVKALRKYKLIQDKNKLLYGEYYQEHYIKKEKSPTNKDVQRIISMPRMEFDIPLEQTYPVFVKENGEFHGTDSMKYPSKVINYELNIRFNFHALRHTHATMLIEAGTPVKTVSERLGHGNVRTTLETYVHVTQSMELDAVTRFDSFAGLNIS